MCGIAGYVTHTTPKKLTLRMLSASLAQSMEDRGHQSWGMFQNGEVIKRTGSITKQSTLPELVAYGDMYLHTRHATHGAVVAENSHPFKHGDIVGAHNGIIGNHDELNKKYGRNFKVDSQHIFEGISLGKSLDDLRGYGAVVFAKQGTRGLLLGTFNGGELSAAKTGIGTVFASTQSAVESACGLSGVPIEHFYDMKDGEVYRASNDGLLYEVSEMKLDVTRSPASLNWRNGVGGLGLLGGSTSLEDRVDDYYYAQLAEKWETLPDVYEGDAEEMCAMCGLMTSDYWDTADIGMSGPQEFLCEECARQFGAIR